MSADERSGRRGNGRSSAEPTIIYCATTKAVDALRNRLSGLSIPVLAYHGRMRKQDRLQSQSEFMDGPPAIMVATNAFGLGIDKPNIRRVIHYDLPGSIEAYYQEFGRAGRDGEPAACTLLFDYDDIGLRKMFASGGLDSSQLMTAHRTMVQGVERFGDDEETVSLTDLKKVSALGRQTLQSCLQHLASHGIVIPAGRGRWQLLVPEMDRSIADRLADQGRHREEDRRIALDQMVRYAESTQCRWSQITNYFEAENGFVAHEPCQCDRCGMLKASA